MAASRALTQLRQFTSCDVSLLLPPPPISTPEPPFLPTDLAQIGDALVKLKYPQGGFLDGLRMFSPGTPGKYFGPAVTVKMVEASDTTAPKPERHFADCNEAGSIMYIQQPKGLPSACWGGLMSTRAKYLGAEAVVIDGRFRDLEEHKELQFPVSPSSLFFPCLMGTDADGLGSYSLGARPYSARTRSPEHPRSTYHFNSKKTFGCILEISSLPTSTGW